jgi:hypothetical protein
MYFKFLPFKTRTCTYLQGTWFDFHKRQKLYREGSIEDREVQRRVAYSIIEGVWVVTHGIETAVKID